MQRGASLLNLQTFVGSFLIIISGPSSCGDWQSVVTRSLNMFMLIALSVGVACDSVVATVAPGISNQAAESGNVAPMRTGTADHEHTASRPF